MNIRNRLRRLEQQARDDDFCASCMTVRFLLVGEPDDRPPTCPRCGRGPGDYGNMIRGFTIARTARSDAAQNAV